MKKFRQAGFTLVELAIVMIIVGLLIGGILKGQELIENARVVKLVEQIKAIESVTLQFRDSYGYYPGDIPNTNFDAKCTAANFCVAGNGDSWIGQALASGVSALDGKFYTDSETVQFWKHLSMAGFIDNVKFVSDPASPLYGSTHPDTSLGSGVEIYRETTGLFNGSFPGRTYRGQMLRFSRNGLSSSQNDTPGQAFTSPRLAARIDRKIDDGDGVTGKLMVWDFDNHGCDNKLDGSPGFEESSAEMACILFYHLNM